MKKQGSNKSQGARQRAGGKNAGFHHAQTGRVVDQLARVQLLRFKPKGVSAGKYTFTWKNLLDTWVFATTTAVGYDLFDLVRIVKVDARIFSQAGFGGNPGVTASIELAFPGSNTPGVYGDGAQYEGASAGTTEPAFVSGAPAKLSQAAQFHTSTTDVAFTLDYKGDGAATGIVEVTLEFKNSAELPPQQAASGLVPAGVVGQLYFRGLDGLGAAATLWPTLYDPVI